MSILVLVGAGVLSVLGYNHWNTRPDNFGGDRSQVIGSSPNTKASTDVPVFSSSYTANGIDGRQSQIPNPHLRERDPRAKAGEKRGYGRTYGIPQPNSDFHVEGTAAEKKDTVGEALAISDDYLKSHPVSTPLSNRRGNKRPMYFDTSARSQMYLGAADTAPIASIPFAKGPTFDHNKHHMDIARAAKSDHHGTLLDLTVPAYGIHPKSAHYATGAHTRIYTGRKYRDDIK